MLTVKNKTRYKLNKFKGLTEFKNDCKGYYPMSIAAEQILLKRAKAGDIKARNILIVNNIPALVSIAKALYREDLDIPLVDLVMESILAMLKSIKRFGHVENVITDVKFMSYAVWWVRQYMNKYLHKEYKQHLPSLELYSLWHEELDYVKRLHQLFATNDNCMLEIEKQGSKRFHFILNKLPCNIKYLFICRFVLDMTYQGIADITYTSRQNIQAKILKYIKKLQKNYPDELNKLMKETYE